MLIYTAITRKMKINTMMMRRKMTFMRSFNVQSTPTCMHIHQHINLCVINAVVEILKKPTLLLQMPFYLSYAQYTHKQTTRSTTPIADPTVYSYGFWLF